MLKGFNEAITDRLLGNNEGGKRDGFVKGASKELPEDSHGGLAELLVHFDEQITDSLLDRNRDSKTDSFAEVLDEGSRDSKHRAASEDSLKALSNGMLAGFGEGTTDVFSGGIASR